MMAHRIRTSRLLAVVISSSTLCLCWLYYGLDFARTIRAERGTANSHITRNVSYLVGMMCGGVYLIFNARDTYQGARQLFLISSLAMAIITALCSTALLQTPGTMFNICRLCQGSAAGVSSSLALMMMASTAKHKNVGWTMFIPAISIILGYKTRNTVPFFVILHKHWPIFSIAPVLIGVISMQLRHESELHCEPEETMVGLHDSIDEKKQSWREPFEQAPLLIQSIGRALIFSYALSGSNRTPMDTVWMFAIQDVSMWQKFKSLGVASDTTIDYLRYSAVLCAKLIFLVLNIFAPSFFEIIGAFTYKRWGLKYHSLVALALGLPGAIVSWWFRGPQTGTNPVGNILRVMTLPLQVTGAYILTVLTPIVAQFANSTYGLSVGIRTRAFAFFVCAIGLGVLLRFVKWFNLRKVPFLGESGVLMVCMACVDLLPDVVQKLKEE